MRFPYHWILKILCHIGLLPIFTTQILDTVYYIKHHKLIRFIYVSSARIRVNRLKDWTPNDCHDNVPTTASIFVPILNPISLTIPMASQWQRVIIPITTGTPISALRLFLPMERWGFGEQMKTRWKIFVPQFMIFWICQWWHYMWSNSPGTVTSRLTDKQINDCFSLTLYCNSKTSFLQIIRMNDVNIQGVDDDTCHGRRTLSRMGWWWAAKINLIFYYGISRLLQPFFSQEDSFIFHPQALMNESWFDNWLWTSGYSRS